MAEMQAPVMERVQFAPGMTGEVSTLLKGAGIVALDGEVPPGENGETQWTSGLGVRTIDTSVYSAAEQPVVDAVNRGAEAALAGWADKGAGVRALARFTGPPGKGGLAHVYARDFVPSPGGRLLVANPPGPTDFVMVTSHDVPSGEEGVGVALATADSHKWFLASEGGDVVGVGHGIRDAVLGGVATDSVAFMCKEAGLRPENLRAVVARGLGVCCQEIKLLKPDEEKPQTGTLARVQAAIAERRVPPAALVSYVDPNGNTSYHFNPELALVHQLEAAGVKVQAAGGCTAGLSLRSGKGAHPEGTQHLHPSLRLAQVEGWNRMFTPGGEAAITVPLPRPVAESEARRAAARATHITSYSPTIAAISS